MKPFVKRYCIVLVVSAVAEVVLYFWTKGADPYGKRWVVGDLLTGAFAVPWGFAVVAGTINWLVEGFAAFGDKDD